MELFLERITSSTVLQPRVLQLLAFQDAFETVNPLGSSKTKFKVVAFYFDSANLPPFLRSKTENLKLILLCREKYINIYGWETILKRVMSDLRILETEGVTVSINGETRNYLGTLLVMLGDSLESHQIGVFTENFNTSNSFCRFCEILKSYLKSGNYNMNNLRNPENYARCAETAKKKNAMVKGIKRNLVLNELEHYHVCNPGLPPCAAHDLFEGVVPFDLMFCIKHFASEGWFSYAELNEHVANFRFLGENKQILPEIKIAEKLTRTASEMRRYFQ